MDVLNHGGSGPPISGTSATSINFGDPVSSSPVAIQITWRTAKILQNGGCPQFPPIFLAQSADASLVTLKERTMGMARGRYVKKGEEGVYHCITRCVRQGTFVEETG